MMHKMAFETLDQTLKDILDNDHPFGGLIIVMCGDFCQLLPVVPKGSRPQIVMTSIRESYIWQHIRIFHLRINMHTQEVSLLLTGCSPLARIVSVVSPEDISSVPKV